MKKTLITLLALGSVAVGAEQQSWNLDLGNTLPQETTSNTIDGLTMSAWTFTSGGGATPHKDNDYADFITRGELGASNLIANYLIDDNNSKYIQYGFRFNNAGTGSIALNSLSFDAFAANLSGNGQGSDRYGAYTLTVGSETHNSGSITLAKNGVVSDVAFSNVGVVLEAGESVEVTLKMAKPSGGQFCFGLSNMSVVGAVTEPPLPVDTLTVTSVGAFEGGFLTLNLDTESLSQDATFAESITLSITDEKWAEVVNTVSEVGLKEFNVIFADSDEQQFALTDVNEVKFHGQSGTVLYGGMAAGTYSIPEPTTATLSLLALAGLAARRRRK